MALSALKALVASEVGRHFPRFWMNRELRSRPGHFEPELFLVPLFCDRQKIAVDVGANEGAYSFYMSRYCRKVIAFEPNMDLFPHLRKLLGEDFRIEAVGLSRENSTAVMRIDPRNTGLGTIEENNDLSHVTEKSAFVERKIETRTLDSFELSDVSLIKIDVEGHEESVIAGAMETIRRNEPVLIIESEDRHNPGAPRRLNAALGAAGYCGFYVKGKQLMDFDRLSEEDTDPESLCKGLTYINNFIFIPAAQTGKVEQVRAYVAGAR